MKIYRPDLEDEVKANVPPCDPIFHDLEPHNFPTHHLKLRPEERERDHRKVCVSDLLITQLQDTQENVLPKRLLLLGRPESGKTALFALLIHYWLHDKTKVRGLQNIDILVAIQCLSLKTTSTKIDFTKDLLALLPESTNKYGQDKILKAMKEMKVLVLIDSLDYDPVASRVDETSLALFHNQRIIIFCRLQFMTKFTDHPLRYQQTQDNMVLRLWGGIVVNPYMNLQGFPEPLSDLFGGLSGKLFQDYCKRLCQVKNEDYDNFYDYIVKLLKTLSVEMKKPFNIYMALLAKQRMKPITAKTLSELYAQWFELWALIYRQEVHLPISDPRDLIISGANEVNKRAHEAFDNDCEYLADEDNLSVWKGLEKIMPFLAHILVPHYSASGNIQTFSFRIAAHQNFFVAKHIENQINYNLNSIENLIQIENFYKLHSLLPMIVGLMRANSQFHDVTKHTIKLGKLIFENELMKHCFDQIINSAMLILAESGLYNKTDGKYDKFVEDLLAAIPKDAWVLLDGNLFPEALQALCECGHESFKNQKPQKLNFCFSGFFSELPGLCDMLEAVRKCDIRFSLQMDRSFLGIDEHPLDDVIKAVQCTGHTSLGKFTGYLKNVKLLDSHPTTRRIYSISLRITEQEQYESLYKISKNSGKLSRVAIRISDASTINAKKLKELPSSITHLTVYIEGVTDESIGNAMATWKAIRGATKRVQREHLRFWDIDEKKLSPSGIIQIIDANLPAERIDVPLQQPLSYYDEERIQSKLYGIKGIDFTVRLLGTVKHARRDLKSKKDGKLY